MRQVPMVTYILLCYTKITVNFFLPPQLPYCMVILPVGQIRGSIDIKNIVALIVTVCIASFEVISELQRERLHHSHAAAFSWNGPTHGQLLQVKS